MNKNGKEEKKIGRIKKNCKYYSERNYHKCKILNYLMCRNSKCPFFKRKEINMCEYIKENKYIRIKIDRPGMSFRASIAINKYCWNERENRYYEINFETFHPYDYKDETEALNKAKEWLENEVKKFQAGLVEKVQ